MGKRLHIIHLNIRSLSKNHEELFITCKEYDIILLSETWLNKNFDSGLIERNGFTLFRQDRDTKINKRGGGLAFYIKTELALYTTFMNNVNDVTKDLEQF